MSNDRIEEGAPVRELPKLSSTEQQGRMGAVAAAAGRVKSRQLAASRNESLAPAPVRVTESIDPSAQEVLEDYSFQPRTQPAPAKRARLTLRQLAELATPAEDTVVKQDWNPEEVNRRAAGSNVPMTGASLAALALRKRG